MLYSGTDPESYIPEYTLVYEDEGFGLDQPARRTGPPRFVPTRPFAA